MRQDDLNLPDSPRYDRPGDTWMCGDSGHSCPNGPSRGGRCPMAVACKPQRTWYGRRRLIVFGVLALSAVILGLSLRPEVAPEVFKPGELSNPHKQILSGTLTESRCTACHRDASISPMKWFNQELAGHKDVSLSDRCLDCHHQTIKRDVAKLAHNLPGGVRERIRGRIQLTSAKINGEAGDKSWHDRMPGPVINQENIECSACHREHRGADGNLLDVSDNQCQTCHSERFGSFATAHPEWNRWPYGRGGEIAFDHRSHKTDHFPKTLQNGMSREFRCSSCHKLNEKNELSRSVSYEVGCKSCHDDALQTESVKGLELVAIPIIPKDVSDSVDGWPEDASGMTDGILSPIAELLVRYDSKTASALRAIPKRDVSRVPQNQQLEVLLPVAQSYRDLLEEMALSGHPAIIERAKKAGVSEQSIRKLIQGLSPQLVAETYQTWFGDSLPGLPNQSSRRTKSPVRLVDFTTIDLTEDADSGTSVLLAIDDSDDDILRLAEKRPQTQRIIKNLDSASDNDLLGGDYAIPFRTKDEGPALQLPKQSQRRKQFSPTSDPISLTDDDPQLPKLPKPRPQARRAVPRAKGTVESSIKPILIESEEGLLTIPDDDQLSESLLEDDDSLMDDSSGDDLLSDDSDDLLAGDDDGSGDLLMDDPLAEDPLAEDPLAEDPLAEDPLAEDPLGVDPLAEAPLPQSTKSKRFDPAEMMTSGGWYRDDLKMVIGYRGSGHSDPVLRAAVEMVRELPTKDPVRQRLLQSRSIQACISCHSGATQAMPSWEGHPLVGQRSEFTKFSHRPHMNVAALVDCVHCHKVNEKGETESSENPVSLVGFTEGAEDVRKAHEFLPMKKHSCAACHTARAAGEGCVKCHRYHISK